MTLLRLRDVSKSYGEGALETPVLRGASFDIEPGTLTLLMGPSGSGKTTLLSIAAGLLAPTSGTVTLAGVAMEDLGEAGRSAMRRVQIGFVFQTYNLFPALSAAENVALAHRMHGMSRPAALRQARDDLAQVGLADRLDFAPRDLSSGQKQRVAIARALAGSPPLVLGDEPTAALDTSAAIKVMELLRDRVTPRSAVVLVTHDTRLERFAHRTLHIEDGVILEDGQAA